MEQTGFCVKCRKNQQMIDTSLDKTSKGVPMLRGKCPVCNTNMTRMLRKDFEFPEPQLAPPLKPIEFQQPIEPPLPTEQLPRDDFQPPRENIQPIEDREKELVEEYVEKARNNEVLKRNGIKVGKNYMKWLVGVLILFIIVFAYLAYNDSFKSESDLLLCNVSVECGNNSCPENFNNCSCNPILICNATSICDFPSELEINLQNSS